MRKFLLCVTAMAALSFAAPVANASPPSTAAARMLAADRAFSALCVKEGAHIAFLTYMADDVRLYDGAHPPILGKKAVAAYYATHPEAPRTRLEWTPLEADASPDGVFGFTRGTWVYTQPRKDSSVMKLTGYYVTLWKRQTDGRYKFTLDIGGTDRKPKGE
jgi:ketosteroid isomerase-like protein